MEQARQLGGFINQPSPSAAAAAAFAFHPPPTAGSGGVAGYLQALQGGRGDGSNANMNFGGVGGMPMASGGFGTGQPFMNNNFNFFQPNAGIFGGGGGGGSIPNIQAAQLLQLQMLQAQAGMMSPNSNNLNVMNFHNNLLAGGRAAALSSGGGGGGRPQTTPTLSGRGPYILYTPRDDDSITKYQSLARKQIELFEASQMDVDAGAQGRNRPIVLGQVGIR